MKKQGKLEDVHRDRRKKKEELEQQIKQAELKVKEKRREIEKLRKQVLVDYKLFENLETAT
jgi:hypothetical protein